MQTKLKIAVSLVRTAFARAGERIWGSCQTVVKNEKNKILSAVSLEK